MEEKNMIQELVKKARKAQAIAADYDQKTVDRIVRAVCKVVYDQAEILGAEAADETKMGSSEGKVSKTRNAALYTWYYLKDKKSVGVVEDDSEKMVTVIAKPAGVIASLTPSTNPVVTPLHNGAHALKGRNAIIFAPHPGAKKSTAHTVELMRGELERLGAPADLMQVIEEPSLTLSQELMAACDITVATGGPGMVKAAYSSGKPSFGVGQGNVQNFLAPDYKDLADFAEKSLGSRLVDNGVPCTCDQTVHVPAAVYDEIINLYKEMGGYYVENEAEVEKLRKTLFMGDGSVNRACVGRDAERIGVLAGIDVPKGTRAFIVKCTAVADEDVLCREIMAPVLRVHPYNDFKEAVENGRKNYLMEGAGHSTAVYSHDEDCIAYVGERIPVCRIAVNQVASSGAGRPFSNGMPHTLSLGCGFWGGNSISENLTYKHMMNYSRIHRVIPDCPHPTDAEIWGEEE